MYGIFHLEPKLIIMFSQEEFGELLVLALEKAFDDLISLPKNEKYYNTKLYNTILIRYEKTVEICNFYAKHSDDLVW